MHQLFDAVTLGTLSLKNRLVMTAMSTCFAGPHGEATDRLVEYYAARASGGVGLITVEEAYIHPRLPHVKNALGVYADHLVEGLRHVTRRIHAEGGLASLQIGLYFRQQLNGFPRYAASADAPDCGGGCKELTLEEIRYLTGLFADAAERTREAGFDAVEVHACHGCLLAEFLSPYWNSRQDAYGGGQEGRFRFAIDILAAIRKRLGPDYPVIFRISGSEFTPDGFTPDDAVALSRQLALNGVSAVSISGGLGHVNHIAIPPGSVSRGLLLPIGKRIRSVVSVPVIVGNSMTPEIAAEAVRSGSADLIGLGRPLIADPDWARKVQRGDGDQIRHCLRCNQGCYGALLDAKRPWISCIYNPVSGREFENPIREAVIKRDIVVIGGGPAGCEFARVARLRGHRVVLIEKTDRLGGQIRLAAVPPSKSDFGKMVSFYEGELHRLGVEVRLNTVANAELLTELAAEVYVYAAGSRPVRPPISGADLPHVVFARDVLDGRVQMPEGPVVVVGGGAAGLETAEFLADRRHPVTVVEMLNQPGMDIQAGIGVREGLLKRLAEKKVRILCGHGVVEIGTHDVTLSDRPLIGGGRETRVASGSIILAAGVQPAAEQLAAGLPASATWFRIGDCCNPGNALQAIHQAFELAIRI